MIQRTHKTRCHLMYKMGLFETICFIVPSEYGLVHLNVKSMIPTEKDRKDHMSWMWNM